MKGTWGWFDTRDSSRILLSAKESSRCASCGSGAHRQSGMMLKERKADYAYLGQDTQKRISSGMHQTMKK